MTITAYSTDNPAPVQTEKPGIWIADKVLFINATINGKHFFISAADDEAEQIPVWVATKRREGSIEPESKYRVFMPGLLSTN